GEAGDQQELNALLGRRSVAQTWRLGLLLLVLVALLALVAHFLDVSGERAHLREQRAAELREQRAAELRTRATVAVGLVGQGEIWTTLTTLPVARGTWNATGKEARE